MPNNSELPLNIDPQTVSRFGIGGVLAGGSAASALALLHMIRQMNAKRREREESSSTGPGTIVLTLPNKSAADKTLAEGIDSKKSPKATSDGNGKDRSEHTIKNVKNMATAGKKVSKDKPVCRTVGSNGKQLRYTDGQFGLKTANWPTLTASLLAAGGGGALGYHLVNKLYEVKRLKAQEKELEQAREEYLDMLGKQSSSPFNDQFSAGEEKVANREGKRSFRAVDYPLGLMALATILGAGGTAYLTKKVLDQYNPDEKLEAPPSVSKVVFRTAPSKQASADDPEARSLFEASLGVYLDVCSGEGRVLGTDKIASAAKEAGTSVAQLYKQAGESYDSLIATLEHNPELRTLIQRSAMEQHPVAKYFKWSAKLPIIRGMLDKRLYQGVENSILGPKQASVLAPDLSSIVSSFYGSELAERAGPKEEVNPSEEEEDADKLERMQLVADDPNAAAFLEKNKKVIAQVLEQLAARNRV